MGSKFLLSIPLGSSPKFPTICPKSIIPIQQHNIRKMYAFNNQFDYIGETFKQLQLFTQNFNRPRISIQRL
jgi:hypothetical protein